MSGVVLTRKLGPFACEAMCECGMRLADCKRGQLLQLSDYLTTYKPNRVTCSCST